MPIHFRCPHCAKLLALGTRQGGTCIHCPLCAQRLTVPRQTEVNVPKTTVMPPDVAQSWWIDAPSLPTTPADAWQPATNVLQANLPPPLPDVPVEHSLRDSEPHFLTRARLVILAVGVVVVLAAAGMALALLL